ncbi:hypothetical protein LCD36_04700 [Saccharopolyspora sp. 6T]|uniref:hypothetical protein n=1 Tax=Saccharopolyspora sp. 6T TaxID=2877238 RepID=UPI001CD63B28|nr:hypothetical protein [Saccharopolyspora sp. 6T]MCA1185752.1 hypothetical protein [Saccharopolyspora sp. 6T]
MTERNWRPLFDAAAALEHEDLINNTVDIAVKLRDGGRFADELVVHARVLDWRYRHRTSSYPLWSANTPRLAEIQPHRDVESLRDAVGVMHVVSGEEAERFAATTAGFIRQIFGANPPDRGMSLASLPSSDAIADDAEVVLYDTLMAGASRVLSAVRDGHDTTEQVEHLINRLVHHRPFPWEPGGWNGD